MKTNRRNPFSRSVSFAFVNLAFCASSAIAADKFWDLTPTPASNIWATAGNWSTTTGADTPDPAAAPGTSDVAIFNNVSAQLTIDVGTATNSAAKGSTTFASGAGAYVIGTSTSQIYLMSSASYAITMNTGVANDQTFNAKWQLGGTGSGADGTYNAVNNSTTNKLVFAGGVAAGASGTKTVAISGAGAIDITSNITKATTGTVILTKSGTGTLTLSGTNNFNGGLALSGASAGQLNINSATALGTGTFTVNSGDLAKINNTSGAAITIANNTQTWTNNFTFVGTNDLNMGTGAITLGGNRAITVSASTLTLGGVIDDGAGSYSLTKQGAGTMTLTGRNTYNGGTSITNGRLNLNYTATANPAVLGNISLSNSSASTTRPTLYFQANNQLESTATISSTLSGTDSIFTEVVLGGTSQAVAGFVPSGAPGATGRTILGNRPSGDLGGGAGVLTINNSSTVTLGGGRLEIRDGGSGTLEIVKDGPGTLVFSLSAASGVSNSYTGGFTMKAGTTQIAGPAFGATTPLKLLGGSLSSSNTTARTFVSGNTVSLAGDVALGDSTNNGKLTFPGAATLSDNRTLTVNSTVEFSGGLGEAVAGKSLTKTGTGTLILAGTNTYTGATNLSAGRLDVAGSVTSNVSVAAGSTLGGEGSILAGSSLTFAAGVSTLAFDPTTGSGMTVPSIVSTGATILVSPDSPLTPTVSYLVITNSAGFSGSPTPTYKSAVRGTLAFTGVGNTELQFTAGAAAALVWKGDNGTNPSFWDINTTSNWNNGVGGDGFFDLDSVTFNDTATSTNVVIQNASVIVGTGGITFNNNTKNYTISGGSINGEAGLVKNGNASLTLSNANNFTGGAILNAGTLNINNATALGAAAGTFIINGGVIDNTSAAAITTASYPLTINSDFTFTGTNDLHLGAGATTLGINPGSARTITTTAGTLTLGGAIGDGDTATGIIKAGNGTLTLAGASTYTGLTTVSAGTLKLGASGTSASSCPLGTTAAGTTVSSGATLDFGGFKAYAEAITIAGTGVSGNGALINSGVDQINALESLTLSAHASIGGNGGRFDLRTNGSTPALNLADFTLTKSGSSYVALVGTTVNPGSGHLDVTGGTLSIQTTTNLGGTAANTITVRNGAVLDTYQSGTWTAPVWSVLMDAGSNFTNSNGSATWDGTVTLNGAANAGGSADLTINGVVSGASGTLTKTGAGTLTLAGTAANTYGGLTTVSAGFLYLNKTPGINAIPGNTSIGAGGMTLLADDQIPNASTVTLTTATSRFNINSKAETLANLDMQNASNTTSQGLLTGASPGGKLTITGTLTHTLGNITLNSSGPGNSSIIDANTVINNGGSWTFGTTDGTQKLIVGSGGLTIGNGSTIAIAASAAAANIISLGGNVTSTAAATTNTISGAGKLNLNATRTFTVADDTPASDLTVSTVIANGSGTGALIKEGGGTMSLGGANTYTGDTTVSAGTLALSLATAIQSSPVITVASGATLDASAVAWTLGASQTLKGNGTVNGSTTLAGTVAPGTSVGTLNLGTTSLTGTYACEVSGASADKIAVSGNLNVSGSTLAISGPLTASSYTIATYTGSLTGTFTSITGVPGSYTINYGTGANSEIKLVLSATPYEIWGAAYGLTAGSEGGDLDNDGLSNFKEFAFGLIPDNGSSVNPITSQLSKTTGQFTYQRLAASGLVYTIWTSSDLVNWNQDTGAVQTPTAAGANESVQVTLSTTVPLAASKTFVRVKAE